MTPKTRAGEAMTSKPTAEAISFAMRDLENDVRALMHMADLAACRMGDNIFFVVGCDDNSQTLRVTRHEFDQLSFLVNDVAERALVLDRKFQAASKGEAA